MVVATGLPRYRNFPGSAVLAVQEHPSLPGEVAGEPMQTSGEVLPNTNPVALPEVVGLRGKRTDRKSSEQATSVDDGFTPDINHAILKANVRFGVSGTAT